MRAGDEAQVWPLEDRLEKAPGRAPAASATLVDLEIGRAFIVPAIEVVDLRNADLNPRLAQSAQAAVMVLLADEVGQHVIPAPAGKAKLAPAVVVGRLAAHVDHGVDSGRECETRSSCRARRPRG